MGRVVWMVWFVGVKGTCKEKPTLVRGFGGDLVGWACLVRLDVVVEARWAVEVEDAVEVVIHRAEVGVDCVGVGVGAVA